MRMAIIVASVMVLVLTGSALSTTITVDWAGSGDFLTIQAGIDSAGTGDTVLVLAGTYTGVENRDLDFGGTNLVLLSDGGYTVTTVDCEDAGRGFLFQSGEDTTSVVRSFTITNAAADSGAGAFCTNGSHPRFEDCLFLGNRAQKRGGGLCCTGSSPVVRDCRFESNSADQDGGSDGYGGGMACLDGSSPTLEDTEFVSNQARNLGGGLHADYAPLKAVGCTFTENVCIDYSGNGAGAHVGFSDGAQFTGCTFTGNGDDQVPLGGGLHVSASDVTITDCAFLDNRSGSGGGIRFTDLLSSTVSGCTFAGNTSDWGAAGGISCYLSSGLTITGCTFVDNEDDHIWCDDSSPTIEYCILAFASYGLPVLCDTGTETPHIHHCFVHGNAEADTLCGGNFHDIDNVDPLFCDRAGGDYRLCADSPCLPGVTWPSLVGAHGQGCPACGNAVEPSRWGTIKAMYR